MVRLAGDISRVDCDISPDAQGFPVQLYQMICGNDGRDAEEDVSNGAVLAEQRLAEAQIINERLMTDSAYSGWDFRSFNENAVIILNCSYADGGICVLNAWNDSFIHVTSWRPTGSGVRHEIYMQPQFYLNNQEMDYVSQGELNQDVASVAFLIAQSRDFFDNPEMREKILNTISEGINTFLHNIF